jgi:hypothetical protein
MTSRLSFLGFSLLSIVPVAAAQYGCRGDVVLGGPDPDGGSEASVLPDASSDGGGAQNDAGTIECPGSPVFSPPGGSYTAAVTVAITAPGLPSSGVIFYTTDGTVPNAGSNSYSQPVQVATSETLIAIATAPGCPIAGPATATYSLSNVLLEAAMPTFAPAPGTYCGGQSITLATPTPGATIFYTTDGTNPSTTSAVYTTPIALFKSMDIRAMTTAPGYQASPIASGQYTLLAPPGTLPPPVIAPVGGVQNNDFLATLSVSSSGGTLCYTLDGTAPTGAGGLCTGTSLTYDAATAIHIDGTVTDPATGRVTVETLDTGIPCANHCCGLDSGGAPATYTLQVAQPSITPASGKIAVGASVAFTTVTVGNVTFHYTVDGSPASCSSASTGAGFTATGAESTVNVVGCKAGYAVSATGSASYTF